MLAPGNGVEAATIRVDTYDVSVSGFAVRNRRSTGQVGTQLRLRRIAGQPIDAQVEIVRELEIGGEWLIGVRVLDPMGSGYRATVMELLRHHEEDAA